MKKYIFICAAGVVILVTTILVYAFLPASLPANGRVTDYPLAEPLRISEVSDLIRLHRTHVASSKSVVLYEAHVAYGRAEPSLQIILRATFFNDTPYVLTPEIMHRIQGLEKFDKGYWVSVPPLPYGFGGSTALWGIFPSDHFITDIKLTGYDPLRPGLYRMRHTFLITSTFVDWEAYGLPPRHDIHDVVVEFTVCRDGEISFADD